MSTPLFVTCIPGLEELLASEIEEVGFTARAASGGAFVSDTSFDALFALNYRLRLAHRVLLPLSNFLCKTKKNLHDRAVKLDWSPYFKKGWTFAVDVNGMTEELRNTQFSAQVIKDGVCDRLIRDKGWRPSVDRKNPDVQLNLHIHQERAVLYYDTSRVPLFKRGYRRETGKAPMQESLAAAMLRIAGYTGEERLCDPCCGSGTLLIEAAMIASKMPAGFFRTEWGFQRLPKYDGEAWKQARTGWDSARTQAFPKITGIEISSEVVAACRANLQAAGFGRKVELRKGPFQQERLECDLIVTNPPYGERLQEKLGPLYEDLGIFIRRTQAPVAYLLTAWEEGGKKVALPIVQAAPLLNGGLPCTLFEVESEGALCPN